MTDNTEPRLGELVREYTSGADARALYIYNGPIDDPRVEALVNVVEPDRDVEASLFLCTLGGDAHAAYRLTRLLHDSHKSIRLLLAGPCKSAGTLVATGAHSIAFSTWGELGPIDVQMAKPEELLLRSSGLDIIRALATVVDSASSAFRETLFGLTSVGLSTRVAAGIATDLTTGLFKEIAGQIDPIRLAEAVRANKVAMEYGERLRTQNLRDGALETLVSAYPDHGFVIDRKEAGSLFATVDGLTDTEMEIAVILEACVRSPMRDKPFIVNAARKYGGAGGEESDADDQRGTASDPVREAAGSGPEDARTAREGGAEVRRAERTGADGTDRRGEAAAAGDGTAVR